ncbi:hypothetical protein [Pandoraea sp. ISTKB]|uniref:hypothetical protein n=1 Tax=Pandoraea sp. ISTKB TaxID=1586708 RepID=UPI0008467E71|nr:hypothetical protein [Pandoraea sp. ISTKB]ODP32622.1 hypothetical protein A9762_22315 [Pandoraea sp. ISTKB]
MNRWRKFLVLMLLCVTMPLQAMASLRTHCAPGTPAGAAPMAMQTVATARSDASAMMGMHHAMTTGDSDAMMAGMQHHGDHSGHADTMLGDAHASSSNSQGTHTHHTSCSACAACVVCTALPPSLVLRLPDAQPSTAIPFLRTSATSAVVAVLERPPKHVVA